MLSIEIKFEPCINPSLTAVHINNEKVLKALIQAALERLGYRINGKDFMRVFSSQYEINRMFGLSQHFRYSYAANCCPKNQGLSHA
jgi:hypothetical protein